MTVQSFTGGINTNGEWVTLSSLTSISFTATYTYTIQIQGTAELKIGSAEFLIKNDNPFDYVAGTDDLYIRTRFGGCQVTVLEKASS